MASTIDKKIKIVFSPEMNNFLSSLVDTEDLELTNEKYNPSEEIDFSIFPKNLRKLEIRFYFKPGNFEHPNLEEISLYYFPSNTDFNLDKFPKLKKLHVDRFYGNFICPTEHKFEEFCINDMGHSSYNENVMIYSERHKKWRCAFDYDKENFPLLKY